MPVSIRQSKKYQGALAVLLLALIVGNVVVVRHRLREEAARHPSYPQFLMRYREPPKPGPAARLAGGAPTQAPFTLMAVTRPPINGMEPPPGITPILQTAGSLQAQGDGVGVWIKVAGGLGFQSISVPAGPGQSTFPIGGAWLVVNNTMPLPPTPSPSLPQRVAQFITHSPPPPSFRGGFAGGTQWLGPGGLPLPYDQWPYEVIFDMTATGVTTGGTHLLLMPRHLDQQFSVTAQALTAAGLPLGGPVTPFCQPVGMDTLFVFLPGGYSPRTAQFDLTVARSGAPMSAAHWRLASLPRPVAGIPGAASSCTRQTAGPLTVEAAAAESPDSAGVPTRWNSPPARQAGYWTLGPPTNVDNHEWTGVPTIRCVLRAQGARAGEDWVVNVLDAAPEWRPAPLPSALPPPPVAGGPLVRASFGVAGPSPWRPVPGGSQGDLVCGVAYPGQQSRLRVEAEAVRHAVRQETVTFQNATLQRDPASGRWEVNWQKAQTLTTPSGLSVVVLNRRPDDRPFAPASHGFFPAGTGPMWNMPVAAELWLAWRVPPSSPAPGAAGADAQRLPPEVLPPLASRIFSFPEAPPTWNDVWLPGTPPPTAVPDARGRLRPPSASATPLAALVRGGYQIARLWVNDPRLLKTATWPMNPAARATLPPLPARLATLGVTFGTRGIVERHPIHLMIPVQAQFPAGWNPNAGDSRFHVLY